MILKKILKRNRTQRNMTPPHFMRYFQMDNFWIFKLTSTTTHNKEERKDIITQIPRNHNKQSL